MNTKNLLICESLREHSVKIVNSGKAKMIPSTSKEYESYFNQTNCHICQEKPFKHNFSKDTDYRKVKDLQHM